MNHIINLEGQKSLQNNIIGLVGKFLIGNIVNDVEVRDSLKGLASFNIACKTTNRATKALLNGEKNEDGEIIKPGLKQILFMKAEIVVRGSSMKVGVYKHHGVILNYLKPLWENTNCPKLKQVIDCFQESFFGLLHYKTSEKVEDFMSYRFNKGCFLNAEHIKRTLEKPSKELHDAYLLMAKFLKECKNEEVRKGCEQDANTCIKCAEAAVSPLEQTDQNGFCVIN